MLTRCALWRRSPADRWKRAGLNLELGLKQHMAGCSSVMEAGAVKEVWAGCKPASSSLDSGNVCVQVSGDCAGAGGQVGQVGQVRAQA